LNDNGSVSKEELRRLIESRGFYVSDKEVSQLVEKIDKDKDGRITYSEVSYNFWLIDNDDKKIFNSYPCHRHGHWWKDILKIWPINQICSFKMIINFSYSSEKSSCQEVQSDVENSLSFKF